MAGTGRGDGETKRVATAHYTVVESSGANEMVLAESDARSRSGRNVLKIVGGVLLILAGAFFLLVALRGGTDPPLLRTGFIGVAGIVLGLAFIGTGSAMLERRNDPI